MSTGASTMPSIARLVPTGHNPAARSKPSGGRQVLRIAAALAGSLFLIVSLVDPQRGSGLHYVHSETLEPGASHE
jgi:hypothetical protein